MRLDADQGFGRRCRDATRGSGAGAGREWAYDVGPMLNVAFTLLLLAAVLGGFLALGFIRVGDTAPAVIRALRPYARGLGLVHGGVAAAGLLALIAALRDPAIHAAIGVAGFGLVAAWLFGIALAFGLVILATARRRRGRASLLVAVHATLAISGIVVLMARVLGG